MFSREIRHVRMLAFTSLVLESADCVSTRLPNHYLNSFITDLCRSLQIQRLEFRW